MAAKKRKQSAAKKSPSAKGKGRAKHKAKRVPSSVLPKRDKSGRFTAKKKPTPRKPSRKPLPRVPKTLRHLADRAPVRVPRSPKKRPESKLKKPSRPVGKQTAKAIVEPGFGAPQYEVTSDRERLIAIHAELRERAIADKRILIPDERLRKVEDPWRKALKKSVTVAQFLNEKTLQEIVYKGEKLLYAMVAVAKAKKNVRYSLELNKTEYGIELYGSDKGEIARVDGLRSEALHWTKWSTGAYPNPPTTLEGFEAGLESFIAKKIRTTVVIESINVTALYDR